MNDRERIDYLEAEVADLRRQLGLDRELERQVALQRLLGIMPQTARVGAALLTGRLLTCDFLADALLRSGYDPPDSNRVVQVQLSHFRRALRRYFGHSQPIANVFGQGWRLDPDIRQRLDRLVDHELAMQP